MLVVAKGITLQYVLCSITIISFLGVVTSPKKKGKGRKKEKKKNPLP